VNELSHQQRLLVPQQGGLPSRIRQPGEDQAVLSLVVDVRPVHQSEVPLTVREPACNEGDCRQAPCQQGQQ
jgi:hypothetical protein